MNAIIGVLFVTLIVATSANVIPENGRIVGGSIASPGQLPYVVSIQTVQQAHICGGAIINNRWILTAGHCIIYRAPNSLVVRVGSVQRTSGGTLHPIHQARIHPQININTRANDLATIQTTQPIAFNFYVRAIPVSNAHLVAVNAIVSGWGQTTTTGALSESLQFLNTVTIQNADCINRLAQTGFAQYITNQHICALTRFGQGICDGDNGAPLVHLDQLIGIASFAVPCGTGAPDAYTRVQPFLLWISQNTI